MTMVKVIRWALIALLVFLVGSVIVGGRVGVLFQALTPPKLPPSSQDLEIVNWDSGQNWSAAQSDEFHFKSQGSRTLNMPLSWFLALETPSDGTLSFLFLEEELFSSPAYLSRFGFVPQEKSKNNPHGLPIGFATSPYQNIVGLKDAKTAIGFTCAACHTGQLVYEGKRYLVEGGQAMIDLEQLTLAVGAALGQTDLAGKIPVRNGRFERFAKRVLKDQYSDQSVARLKSDLDDVIKILAAIPNAIDVTEGYSRLDALNRIGNQVFAIDPSRDENYVNLNAPVNFPFIWTSSWFDWVQYDGSIMRPLVRNAGEAMGTAAHTNFTAPRDGGRFSNAIPMKNLDWIETQLAGPDAPLKAKAFNGLRAPRWPEAVFGELDDAKVKRGAELYEAHCESCHRPALTKSVESGLETDNKFWKYFEPVRWQEAGQTLVTRDSYFKVQIVDQSYLGTDPAQGEVLALRKVNTSSGGSDLTELGVDKSVCIRKPGSKELAMFNVTDGPLLSYPYALGAVVQLGIDQWFAANDMQGDSRLKLEGDKPNCLQAGGGYKARPLNGVWSTAPFLHNGSVPTLRALLGPPLERPESFLLGNPEFDPIDVGIVLAEVPGTKSNYTDEGYFVLRTAIRGNSNKGHAFTDDEDEGRIGPAFAPDEIDDMIEFLKSL